MYLRYCIDVVCQIFEFENFFDRTTPKGINIVEFSESISDWQELVLLTYKSLRLQYPFILPVLGLQTDLKKKCNGMIKFYENILEKLITVLETLLDLRLQSIILIKKEVTDKDAKHYMTLKENLDKYKDLLTSVKETTIKFNINFDIDQIKAIGELFEEIDRLDSQVEIPTELLEGEGNANDEEEEVDRNHEETSVEEG